MRSSGLSLSFVHNRIQNTGDRIQNLTTLHLFFLSFCRRSSDLCRRSTVCLSVFDLCLRSSVLCLRCSAVCLRSFVVICFCAAPSVSCILCSFTQASE